MARRTLSEFDEAVFSTINASEEKIEQKLQGEVLFYHGEIRPNVVMPLRNFIEKLVEKEPCSKRLIVCLRTPGGSAETVEKIVEIIRHHFSEVFFIVPDVAMSAGTIFCMSGDRIYMDYSSSLGPIDPQVPDRDDKYLVPALGYLDKVKELIEKSRQNTITAAEFALLEKQDLAMLRVYEQARDLSIALLKQWLIKYKFKDWIVHRTTNKGAPVTDADKLARAEEIATQLSDNGVWHSHGRLIGMHTLRQLRLEIEDLESDRELHVAVRRYSDTLCDYLMRQHIPMFLYNRHV
ncbi:MAG TPA: serine dehydrogenasease [Alphaproteobacteria bacterium]|nr:serine dehydrogenasease [Alphaproteobacteria bacterium]HAJ47498.1 serine dehydrogenasease [Alphaproteobacteria bacterium]